MINIYLFIQEKTLHLSQDKKAAYYMIKIYVR
jgi:hypothetical protein